MTGDVKGYDEAQSILRSGAEYFKHNRPTLKEVEAHFQLALLLSLMVITDEATPEMITKKSHIV